MNSALRLPLLIFASLLSLYAAVWLFQRVTLNALLLGSGLIDFAISALFLTGGLAALSGIAQGWRARHSPRAWGEALFGFILMLGVMLFFALWPLVTRHF